MHDRGLVARRNMLRQPLDQPVHLGHGFGLRQLVLLGPAADLALQWAVSVGPDIGGKLLVRNGMADECLSLACDKELVSEFSLLFKMKFY